MATLTDIKDILGLNDEGFLKDRSRWNEHFAQKLAQMEGLGRLDDEQLAIITAMQEHYDQHESFPILASICKHAGSKYRDCVGRKFRNPMLAWKLAGLPKPSNIFFTSFDGERYIPNPFY